MPPTPKKIHQYRIQDENAMCQPTKNRRMPREEKNKINENKNDNTLGKPKSELPHVVC